jgi:hypothetical protein
MGAAERVAKLVGAAGCTLALVVVGAPAASADVERPDPRRAR